MLNNYINLSNDIFIDMWTRAKKNNDFISYSFVVTAFILIFVYTIIFLLLILLCWLIKVFCVAVWRAVKKKR